MAIEAVDIQVISGSQSVKIPDSLRIKDDKVYLKKVGSALYIIPFHDPWQDLRNSVDEFSEDFLNDREQPNEQIRDSFD